MDYTERIDYSSLSSYIDCPRKFFFQYILHLRHRSANIDLIFGSCWHYGLEVAYLAWMEDKSLTSSDLISISCNAMKLLWSIEGKPHFPDPDIIFPKNPGRAMDMYAKYWERFYYEDQQATIIGVESPFTLHLADNLPDYIGRMDLVLQDDKDFINIIDHKTAKFCNAITLAGYEASYQTEGYLTAGHMYFDKLPRITYNVALAQKTAIDFTRATFTKRTMAIERFLRELKVWLRRLLNDLEYYKLVRHNISRNYHFMPFQRNPGYACTMYFRKCAYYDLCTMRNNPMPWGEKAPQGYIHYEWDPATHEEEMRKKIEEVS